MNQDTNTSGFKETSRRYIVNPNFILREIAGEAVLVPVGDTGIFENSMITLNESCQYLWKQFQTSKTLEEVMEKAREDYDDPDGVMEAEIKGFVEDSLRAGMLKEE